MSRVARTLGCLMIAGLLVGCSGKRVRDAERAVLTDPGAVEVWVMLGDSYRKAHRKTDALASYQRALSLSPDNEEILGRIREMSTGNVSKMERKALRNPLDDELWGDVGDEFSARGERDRALSYYLYAFRLDPSDSEWQRKVIEHGGVEHILEIVESQVEGANDETLGDFGDMLREAGHEDRACELFRQANAMDPADSEWIEKLSQCGYGDYSYDPGVEPEYYDPGHYDPGYNPGGLMGGVIGSGAGDDALVALARSSLSIGDKEKALEYFQAALMQDAADREALTGVMVLTGKTLVEVLETLSSHLGDDDEVWGDLGDAYTAVGRFDDALSAYQRASSIDPGDREWRSKISIIDPDATAPSGGTSEPLFHLPQ